MLKCVLKIVLFVFLVNPIKTFSQTKLVNERCLTDNSFDDRYASYSPSGEKIVFESNRDGNWEIYLMDSSGNNVRRLTFNEADDRRPTWHPSGKKVLFESTRNGKNELYTLNLRNLRNLKTKQITNFVKGEPLFGNFSPDGKLIAVGLKESEDITNIILLDRKGRKVSELTNSSKRSNYPKWSEDGSKIVYFSRKDTNNQDDEIYSYTITNGTGKRLTHWPKHNFCPSWSSDGSKIAYVTSMEGTRPEIYVMDSDGKNQVRITTNEDGDTLPNWAPNRNKLIITGYRNGNFQICELELK